MACRQRPLTPGQITKRLWAYIKEKNLPKVSMCCDVWRC